MIGLAIRIGTLVAAALMAVAPGSNGSTVGDQEVPTNLNCEEDEAIYFVRDKKPGEDHLGCVHVDSL